MKTVINKIDHGMAAVEKTVSLVAGVLLFALMTWCVLARYFFALSAPYQTELAQTFHIWLCFMGSSYLFSINDNPSVEIFSGKVLAGKNKTFKKVYFTILYLSEYILCFPACIGAFRICPPITHRRVRIWAIPISGLTAQPW